MWSLALGGSPTQNPPPKRFSSYMWMGTPHGRRPAFGLIKFYAQPDVWCFNLLGRFGDDLPLDSRLWIPKCQNGDLDVLGQHLAKHVEHIFHQTLVGQDLKDRQEGTCHSNSWNKKWKNMGGWLELLEKALPLSQGPSKHKVHVQSKSQFPNGLEMLFDIWVEVLILHWPSQ